MAVKVFISYSHKDEPYKDQLVAHLSALKNLGVIQQWDDRQIELGQQWDNQINTAMNDAELILLLVSSDFLASDYIVGKEISTALERSKRNETKLVPIIVRPCDFADTPLAQFQATPKNAKPISTWSNQDEAFLDVIQHLKMILMPQKSSAPAWISPSNEAPAVANSAPHFDADEIRNMIASNKIELAISALTNDAKTADKELYNMVLMQSGKFNDLKKKQRMGIIETSEANMMMNQINAALLDIISELEEKFS